MKLTGSQFSQLQQALLNAYTTKNELSQMVRIELDENLAAIASDDNLTSTVFNLIGWAERTGKIIALIEGAQSSNPGNDKLNQWIDVHGSTLDAKPGSDDDEDHQTSQDDAPWWSQVNDERVGGVDLGDTDGDVIIASVGAGSSGIAIGKNIQQQIYNAVGEPAPDDAAKIAEKFKLLTTALSSVDEQVRQMVEFQLGLLEGELSKTADDQTPSGSTITQVGDWLLDNAPQLTQELTSLFRLPTVGKVLAKTGEPTIEWVRNRFG